MGRWLPFRDHLTDLLGAALASMALAYVVWKILESPGQALQFTFNGLSVGAIYALLAMGFTIVYSTVWFFDLSYGAVAAIGAYGVFYLRSHEAPGGPYDVNSPYVNGLLAAVIAGVAAWALHEWCSPRVISQRRPRTVATIECLLAVGIGTYVGVILSYPEHIHLLLLPAIATALAIGVSWTVYRGLRLLIPSRWSIGLVGVSCVSGVIGGSSGAWIVATEPSSQLYVSWAVAGLMAGAIGLALYRGLYLYVRKRSRSPLIVLVASLGVLLAITAVITIVFESAPRPLPETFGREPWTIWGGHIKGFNLFTVGTAIGGFILLLILLKATVFGRQMRAVGDDEEASRMVGINSTAIISVVFFIGALFAATAGFLNGHDTAIQPRMGLLLLLKGWIAAVVGGIGNIYGAILGGFTLGMIEQFGIWDLAGEWRDVISFVLLIVFLSFWPKGLLPRR